MMGMSEAEEDSYHAGKLNLGQYSRVTCLRFISVLFCKYEIVFRIN